MHLGSAQSYSDPPKWKLTRRWGGTMGVLATHWAILHPFLPLFQQLRLEGWLSTRREKFFCASPRLMGEATAHRRMDLSSRASPRLVLLITDRGSFCGLALALEGLARKGGTLPQGPRAPPRPLVPLTTSTSGRGP
uniref:Uncharacterized protein n=1 Tax=Solanum tuberosum TaxID=4113 RepID=M1D9U9_SOLTU